LNITIDDERTFAFMVMIEVSIWSELKVSWNGVIEHYSLRYDKDYINSSLTDNPLLLMSFWRLYQEVQMCFYDPFRHSSRSYLEISIHCGFQFCCFFCLQTFFCI